MKIREITSHKSSGVNNELNITAHDEPGAGGANHLYHIGYKASDGTAATQVVKFQRGPISEQGVNGITNEALLAILLDRLRGFQSGKFPCNENMIALTKLYEAMDLLKQHTQDRVSRGVEGVLCW